MRYVSITLSGTLGLYLPLYTDISFQNCRGSLCPLPGNEAPVLRLPVAVDSPGRRDGHTVRPRFPRDLPGPVAGIQERLSSGEICLLVRDLTLLCSVGPLQLPGPSGTFTSLKQRRMLGKIPTC